MTRCSVAALAVAILTGPVAFAQHGHGGHGPTVYGATGRPYGPTQSEYQYQLQYGHPSPGNAGGGLGYVNGYPGVGNWGTGGGWNGGGGWGGNAFVSPFIGFGFNPYGSYPPNGYTFYPSTATYGTYYNYNINGLPGVYGQTYLSSPTPPIVFGQDLPPLMPLPNQTLPNQLLPGQASGATINQFPTIANAAPIVPPSTPQAQESSLQFQTQGDQQLRLLNYLAASERYRKSIDAAKDRPDPRYRLAVTLAARSRFLEAVDQLKLAVAVDPTWPQRADSLSQLMGSENSFEKTRIKQRVAEWTLQDARDPNRLFLLGGLLYMDGDPKAQAMLETAVAIAGKQEHFLAFLAPRTNPIPPPHDSLPAAVPHPATPADQRLVPEPPAPQLGPAEPKLPTAPPASIPQKPIPAIPPLPDEAASPPQAPPAIPGDAQTGLAPPVLPPAP